MSSRAVKSVRPYQIVQGKAPKGKKGSTKDIATGGSASGGKKSKAPPITPGYEEDKPKSNSNAGGSVDYGAKELRKKAGAMESS